MKDIYFISIFNFILQFVFEKLVTNKSNIIFFSLKTDLYLKDTCKVVPLLLLGSGGVAQQQ